MYKQPINVLLHCNILSVVNQDGQETKIHMPRWLSI